MLWVLWLLLVVLVLLDAWITDEVIQGGGRELNPLLRWMEKKLGGWDRALGVSALVRAGAGAVLAWGGWGFLLALLVMFQLAVVLWGIWVWVGMEEY